MARRVVPMDVRLVIAAFEAVDDGSANVSQVCRNVGYLARHLLPVSATVGPGRFHRAAAALVATSAPAPARLVLSWSR